MVRILRIVRRLAYFLKVALLLSRKSHPLSQIESNYSHTNFYEETLFLLINVPRRVDRLQNSIEQFASLGVKNYVVVEALEIPNGALGCSLSHLKAINFAKMSKYSKIVVCEDDFEVLVDRKFFIEIIERFFLDSSLKVLCLANNPFKPPLHYSPLFDVCEEIRTTACYAVRKEDLSIIEKAALESIRKFNKGYDERHSALDVVWTKQQFKNLFALPRELCVRQRPDYSDIQKRFVNYENEIPSQSELFNLKRLMQLIQSFFRHNEKF